MSENGTAEFPPIVSVEWVMANLGDVQIIDTSWEMTSQGRPHYEVFLEQHIPGAIHLDVEKVAAPSFKPPHRMVPEPALFAKLVGDLGIRQNATLVFYDNAGLYTAARAWWLFRGFGHKRCAVLDGGLPAWIAAGGEVESGKAKAYHRERWTVPLSRPRVRDYREVLASLQTGAAQVVDARPPEQFNGDTSFRYPGVRPGHIPGSINLSQRNLRDEKHLFKSPEEIRRIFSEHGVDLTRPVIATCGSGITACILDLALAVAGTGDITVYDGSWEEWGGNPALPSEVTPA